MIRRFDEEKPVEDRGYDVFTSDGDYIGYCVFDTEGWYWYQEDDENEYEPSGTYYSDDHDDWLRMLGGLIEIQNKYNK